VRPLAKQMRTGSPGNGHTRFGVVHNSAVARPVV